MKLFRINETRLVNLDRVFDLEFIPAHDHHEALVNMTTDAGATFQISGPEAVAFWTRLHLPGGPIV